MNIERQLSKNAKIIVMASIGVGMLGSLGYLPEDKIAGLNPSWMAAAIGALGLYTANIMTPRTVLKKQAVPKQGVPRPVADPAIKTMTAIREFENLPRTNAAHVELPDELKTKKPVQMQEIDALGGDIKRVAQIRDDLDARKKQREEFNKEAAKVNSKNIQDEFPS